MTVRVLILQRLLPTYRVPFFQRLSASPKLTVAIACGEPYAGDALRSVRPTGVEVLDVRNQYFGRGGAWVVQRGVRAVVERFEPDVVIAEFNPRIVTNLLVWRAALRCGRAFLWWGHGVGPHAGRSVVRFRMFLARRSQGVIFYADAQAEAFVAAGFDQARAYVAPNAIDTETIGRLAAAPDAPRHRVLCIGRLIAAKKVGLLVRAFASAQSGLPDETRLAIVGDGPERPQLVALAWSLGVHDAVEFAGEIVDERALASWFNTAWASISPGYVGLAAIHSLAYGVPMVVADDEPHSPEIAAVREGENAVFFRADDVDDLAASLRRLAADSARLGRLAGAARGTVARRFSVAAMVEVFERAITQSIGGGTP